MLGEKTLGSTGGPPSCHTLAVYKPNDGRTATIGNGVMAA
jgi:hypothetical protein